jgi:phage protein D
MSTPAFRIVADGKDVSAAIADRLLSIRINDQAGQQSDSLEISLDDRDSLLPVPKSGSKIQVWLGYSSNGKLPVYMGTYAVDEVELSMGPRSMSIKATAAHTAPKLVKQQRTQSWHGKTLGDVVKEIAGRNGLTPVIKGDLASIQIQHEDQTNESDQSFLTRLAEKYKATIKPADGKLVVVPRSEGAGSFTIQLSEVSDWRCTLKNRGAYGQVKVKWLDRTTNKEKNKTHGQSDKLPTFEEKQLFRNEQEATKAAESRLQSLKAGEVRISLKMQGRPDLNADGTITLSGFREYVDGTWVIKSVSHELGSGGYSTSVECGTKGEEDSKWAGGKAGASQ